MRAIVPVFFGAMLLGVSTSAFAECSWDETRTRCSKEERDVKVRSSEGFDIALTGIPLGYGEWFAGCVGAPFVDARNCVREKIDILRERIGDAVGGIRINVKPISQTKDLSDLRKDILRLREPKY